MVAVPACGDSGDYQGGETGEGNYLRPLKALKCSYTKHCDMISISRNLHLT